LAPNQKIRACVEAASSGRPQVSNSTVVDRGRASSFFTKGNELVALGAWAAQRRDSPVPWIRSVTPTKSMADTKARVCRSKNRTWFCIKSIIIIITISSSSTSRRCLLFHSRQSSRDEKSSISRPPISPHPARILATTNLTVMTT
jgi:hypothetical protein